MTKVTWFNTDESAFRYHVPIRKAVGFTGCKRLCGGTYGGGGNKDCFTLVLGCTSDGFLYPPSVILKGKKMTIKKIEENDGPEMRAKKIKRNKKANDIM